MDRIREQQEFVEWLKIQGMYNPMESGLTMEKMFCVYMAGKESCDEEIKKLEGKNSDLRVIIMQVHSWIVCSAITSPEDMMENADWIEDITDLSKKLLYNVEGGK